MPQYLLSVCHDDDYELDFSTPDAQRQGAQVGAFNEQLQQSGIWVFACGLHPASSATVVRSAGGDVSMTDCPYAETKEQMGGFWVIRAADMNAARSWLARPPPPASARSRFDPSTGDRQSRSHLPA